VSAGFPRFEAARAKLEHAADAGTHPDRKGDRRPARTCLAPSGRPWTPRAWVGVVLAIDRVGAAVRARGALTAVRVVVDVARVGLRPALDLPAVKGLSQVPPSQPVGVLSAG